MPNGVLPGGGTTCEGLAVARDEYTPSAYVTYGAILALSLFAIWHHLLRGQSIDTDGWFLLALLPYVILGPAVRALEDAGVFRERLLSSTGEVLAGKGGAFAFLFISPFIYIQIGLWVVLALMLGVFLRNRRASTTPVERIAVVAAAAFATASVIAFTSTAFYPPLSSGGSPPQFFVVAHPGWALAGAALAVGLFAALDRRSERTELVTAAALGLVLLAPVVGLLARWATDPWARDVGTHYSFAGYLLLFVLGAGALVWAVGQFGGRAVPQLAIYALGINVLLVVAHMLDGFATFLTLCAQPTGGACNGAAFLNLGLDEYAEKHPVSAVLLGQLNGWAFPLAKLAMVAGIIWLLDKEEREGGEGDRALVGLIRLAIFVLGFGPGLRDALLVTFDLGAV